MKIHQHRSGRAKGSVFEKTTRLTFRAENEDEEAYLAWLANAVRSGQTREIYFEEMSKEPDVLEGLTEEDLINAKEVIRSMAEGRQVHLHLGDVEDLESKGLVRDVTALPGRGRYAGRFEFMATDRCEIVVLAMARQARR